MKDFLTGGRQTWRALVGLLATLPMLAWAAPSATVTVKVTVVAPPPCVINDDRPIEVEFGDVMTTRVDGSSYRMPVNYTLDCTGAPSNAMKLQIQGNGASFDSTVLQTTQPALGVQLHVGSARLPINTAANFTYPNKPVLFAVPVKKSGATLTGGEFTAAATMKVDYQ
ncbi:fimbrial protein [Serratia fonticola]